MSNVTQFPTKSTPDSVLQDAAGKLKATMVLGIDLDGKMYADISRMTIGDAIWLLEKLKLNLIKDL